MGDERERLFRDDAGAALERVARLEEENAILRGELANARANVRTVRTPSPPSARGGVFAVLAMGAFAMVASALWVHGREAPPLPPRIVVLPSPTPTYLAPLPPLADDPPAAPTPPQAFDRSGAAMALAAVDVQSCKSGGDGPTGSGHVKITFAPDGTVTSATVDSGAFPGTGTGACVAGRFRKVRIAPFAGGAVTVGKSFAVQ
jgi:hypothetical protein